MSREWDQGKDQWQQEGWEDHYSQGQVRGREGDYPREGKRQKHNDGVCNSRIIVFNTLIRLRRAMIIKHTTMLDGMKEGTPPRRIGLRTVLRSGLYLASPASMSSSSDLIPTSMSQMSACLSFKTGSDSEVTHL
jgi:hypothetical protein